MVHASKPDSGRGSADIADEPEPGTPDKPEASDQLVPEKQIYRWKDDGGAVMPDS